MDYQFQLQVPEGTWYWTARVDVSQASPTYAIRDIRSPFGLLRDSIAIPGAVVTEMADALTTLQSAFAPSILLNLTSLTLTLDEGRGWSEAQDVLVTNAGVFGSLLAPTLTTSAVYVRATPARLGGLSFNESATVSLMADSTALLASGSPYAATVLVQDSSAVNTPQTISLVLVVRPKAHIHAAPDLAFVVTKPTSGPFPTIPGQTFTVTNSGDAGSVLDYQITKLCGNSSWLVSYSPVSGTLASVASAIVSVTVRPPDTLGPGIYTETLRVSGYSDNSYQDVAVTLTVS